MTHAVFRLPAILAGAVGLTGLASFSTADAAVRHGHAGGMSVHRPAMAGRAGTAWRGHAAAGSRVAGHGGWSHRYGYGWRGYGWRRATVAGGVVGVGYGYPYSGGGAYAYHHHSCWWYRRYAPDNTPSWCGYAYGSGPSYSYVYGSGPYGYGYTGYGYRYGRRDYGGGYRRNYAWTRSTGAWSHDGHLARMNGTHFNPMAVGGGHGAHVAAIPHGGLHIGGHAGGGHFVH